jgi:hypothetical protein
MKNLWESVIKKFHRSGPLTDERNGESRCKVSRLKVLRQSFGGKDIMSLASTVYVPRTTDKWTE